jgi:hypothetical protein
LYPFTFKPHVIIPYAWGWLHCVHIPHFLDEHSCMYDLFNVLLNSVSKYFIENFCIYVH